LQNLPQLDDSHRIAPPQIQVRRRMERLAFQARRTTRSTSPESVHDLRVAIRRAEQALVTLKVCFPRKPAKRIRKQLKAVLSAAGAVRDFDIAIEILSRMNQPGAAELRRDIRARRKAAEKSLLTALKRLSLRTRLSRWCDDLNLNAPEDDFERELRSLAASRLPRLAQRFFDGGRAAASQHSAQKLHEFRIRAKKFRYTLELFMPLYGQKVEEWTADIKSVQNILGAMNDYRSVLSLATAFGSGKKLKTGLKRSERRKIGQFRKVWRERFSPSAAAGWIRLLRRPQEPSRIVRKPITSATAPARGVIAAGA
jgi:CHAD domain-containing protein